MKNTIRLISDKMKKYIDWSLQNRFKGFLSIVCLVILIFSVIFISTPKLKRNTVPSIDSGEASAVIEEIETVTNLGLPMGEIKVHDDPNSNLELYFNTKNANIRVYDTELDVSWNTTFNSNKELDTLETYEIDAMSLLNLTYYGKDGSSSKWNIFEFAVIPGNYKINKIEDGVQLVFNVLDVKSVNLFEHIPQEISKERYESIFIDGIANADISESERNNLTSTFNYCYRFNEEKNSYYYRFATTPQLAMINYLIYSTELFEYTQEDLISDNAEYDIETIFIERPHFEVTMEFILDDGDFVVKVPTKAVKNLSDYFEIISFDVLPNMGGADYQYSNGYVVLPDGSGAVMNLDSYQDAYPWYKKAVYDNNKYYDIYNQKEYTMDIEMPVFGMTYKRGGSTPIQGYFGIIEHGEELSYVNAQVSDGYTMNQSYSSFDTIQYNYLKVFGPYAIQTNLFRASTPYHDFTYQVRYKLLDENNSTYYDMSQIYKEYLIETLELEEITEQPKIHMDVLGGLSVSDRLFGIPYERIQTFTTTSQLDTLLTELDSDISVNYMGVLNGGVKNDLMNKVDVINQIEDGLSLQQLQEKHPNIYVGVNLLKAYGSDNGMRDRYGIHDFYGETLEVTQYNPATKEFEDDIATKEYRIVSPRYLDNLVDRFINKSADKFNNIMLLDMGSMYYTDYRRSSYVSGMESFMILNNNLQKLSESSNIIMNDPFMEFLPYTNMITDVSRESSNYGAFSESIPFKQLVLNGLIPFTTDSVNHETSVDVEYFFLQYAELGAIPKFFISYQNTISLKETEFNRYYSVEYENHKSTLYYALLYVKQIDDLIENSTIINHEIVSENVFVTTYEGNVKVYVNYNDFDVIVTTSNGQQVISPYDYIVE
jgi:hypothetical protein